MATGPVRPVEYYNSQVLAHIGPPIQNPGIQPGAAKGKRVQSGESRYTIGLPVRTSHPQIRREDRFIDSNLWSTSFMDSEELRELFNLLHATLAHVPYAVCGLAALIDHGLTNRQANRVSIICPRPSRKNVLAWAATKNYAVHGDSIGIPTSNGQMRRVRVKFVEHGFEELQRVRSSSSNATVLSITSQLDNVAAGWLDNKKRGDERALGVIASDIFFCLDRIAARREQVDPMYLPTFLGEGFFADFTARYTTARAEMALAGIDVGAVLAEHRAAAALREHDEFLRQFGMKGDTVRGGPRGQFEDISMSVYTVRERDTPSQTSPGRIPAMPWPPRQVYQSVRDRGDNNPGPSRLADGPALDVPGRSLTARRYGRPKTVVRPEGNWI
ncbi:hypothetical protein F4803DRAFT_506669 [Xylaria telfairii]|nr:hypothetical protein F4803DRAFT_506669 [Xylaria telfairii]